MMARTAQLAVRPARRVARDAATFGLGSAAAQALTLLVAPLVTRLFSPASVGAAGVLTAAMAFATPAVCLRFDLAIPLARSTGEAAGLCAVCGAAGAAVVAALGVVALVLGDDLCVAVGVPQMGAYAWLVPMQAAVAVPALIAVGLLTRQRRYGSLAATRLAQAVGQCTTLLGAGYAAAAPAAAWFAGGAIAGTAGWSAAAVALARRRAEGLRVRAADALREGRAVLRKWRRYATWSSGAVTIQGAGLACPPILIAALYGPAWAGLYLIAQRVIGLPAILAGEAVASAWFGTAAEIVRERRGFLREPLATITRSMLVGGGLATAAVLVVGPAVFGTIFGSDWHAAGALLVVLAPVYLSLFATSPAGMTMQALGRTDLMTIVALGRLASPLVGIPGGHALGWSLTGALALYAAGMVATSAANVAMAWRLTGNRPEFG